MTFMTKRVFITGGTGFLGVHLARKSLKDGYTVALCHPGLSRI